MHASAARRHYLAALADARRRRWVPPDLFAWLRELRAIVGAAK